MPPRAVAVPVALEARTHASATVRVLMLAAGTLSLLLGVIGIFTPVLPTTPFVLLAAACYARGSERLFRWLVSHRTFGPLVADWHRYRSIPRRVKRIALAMMAISLATSILLFVRPGWMQAVVAAIGLIGAAWVWRIPAREEVVEDRSANPTRDVDGADPRAAPMEPPR